MTAPRRTRLLVAGALFVVLVLIALFVRDRFVRPHGGDFLVVIFLHLLLRALTPLANWTAAALVFAVACAMELAQAYQLAAHLGFAANSAASVALGTHADWLDLLMYAAGCACAGWLDRACERPTRSA